MNTKTKIMGFLITSALVLTAPLVYADNGNGGGMSGGQVKHDDHQGGMFFHKLHLTDDQQKQLKDIWQKQREANKAAFEQMKANRDAITNELLQTTPDVNKINDLKSKIEALGAQMFDSRISSDLDVKKVLTPEQFAMYLEFQKYKFDGRGKWDHHGCHMHHHGNGEDQHSGDHDDND